MIKKIFGFLLMGALRKQRGDGGTYFLRAAFWVALSTSMYITSIAHLLFEEQFLAFSKVRGESLFSYKHFDGSFLCAGLLTFALMITFFWFYYPQIVDDFKASTRKGMRYSVFLLYFLPSFVFFLMTRGQIVGY